MTDPYDGPGLRAVDAPVGRRRSVAVIGGGMAGLVAARQLARAGADVLVLESSDRLGGQLRTEQIGGTDIDVGAEALHLAGPAMDRFVDDLDLSPDLVRPNPSCSWIWTGKGLRRLPAGVGPAGPARIAPLLAARILSPTGLARAAVEPLAPRSDVRADVSIGRLLSQRFGHELVDRIVDPLLGTLHAGDVHALSARATAPYLVRSLEAHRSLILARRRQPPGAPAFATLPGGLGSLSARLLAGTTVRARTTATAYAIEPHGHRYRVLVSGGGSLVVDGVVVASPLAAASSVLRRILPADALPYVRTASVVTVVVAYPKRAVAALPAMAGTGLLVPSGSGRLLKAATFLSSKWPHLASEEHAFVRLSAGRVGCDRIEALDDDELVNCLHEELCHATGFAAQPVDRVVRRWRDALPQLEVGHVERIAGLRAALAAYPAVTVAGAAYDGLGISACVASGMAAATAVDVATSRAEGRT